MSKERELLESCLDEMQYHNLVCPELKIDIKELLAQPEQEGVYQKLSRIEDGNEVEILPSELWQDGYETGKRTMQPEQEQDLWVVTNPWGVNEYLWSEPREQVYENYKVTKFYRLPPPTREPLSTKQAEDLWETTFKSSVPYYIFDEICVAIEQYHGIGVDDE